MNTMIDEAKNREYVENITKKLKRTFTKVSFYQDNKYQGQKRIDLNAIDSGCLYNAGSSRNIEFLRENGFDLNDDEIQTIMEFGKIKNMKWLDKNGFNMKKGEFRELAKWGKLKTMKFLHENGFDLNDDEFQKLSMNDKFQKLIKKFKK